jgi:hypothetical protein
MLMRAFSGKLLLRIGFPSACILRFRSGLEAHQIASSNSSRYTLPDSKALDTSKVYQAEIERMQNQISDLTKRLAEREAGKLSDLTRSYPF